MPVASALAGLLGKPVAFATDCIGPAAQPVVESLAPGSIAVLENLRFHAGEEKNDPAFVAELARLGDLYVNDAFSAAHRAHASTEGLAHVLPAYAGRALQAEIEALLRGLGSSELPVSIVGRVVAAHPGEAWAIDERILVRVSKVCLPDVLKRCDQAIVLEDVQHQIGRAHV